MRVLIDACVLFPTVLREIVIGIAGTGAFTPLWSERIMEEWRLAARRFGPQDEAIAIAEISSLISAFPDATVDTSTIDQSDLHLPDPDDIHVLAAAIAGEADELLTLNVRDFPIQRLAEYGIIRRHPDEFLLETYHADSAAVREVVAKVLNTAASHGIDTNNPRSLMKKARLPRLGKALYHG